MTDFIDTLQGVVCSPLQVCMCIANNFIQHASRSLVYCKTFSVTHFKCPDILKPIVCNPLQVYWYIASSSLWSSSSVPLYCKQLSLTFCRVNLYHYFRADLGLMVLKSDCCTAEEGVEMEIPSGCCMVLTTYSLFQTKYCDSQSCTCPRQSAFIPPHLLFLPTSFLFSCYAR